MSPSQKPSSAAVRPPELLVALISAPVAEAPQLAEALVARGLVACVNLLPAVESFFVWEGRAEREREALLLCKTTPDAWPRLLQALPDMHPYDVPECIALPCHGVLEAYADWARLACDGRGGAS